MALEYLTKSCRFDGFYVPVGFSWWVNEVHEHLCCCASYDVGQLQPSAFSRALELGVYYREGVLHGVLFIETYLGRGNVWRRDS